jgi:hypothetical protein
MTLHEMSELIEEEASYRPMVANNDDPVDDEPTDSTRVARARHKALAALKELQENDPDFQGIELTTDKLFAYILPPKEYYRAQVDTGVSLFQLPAMRAMSSAELKQSIQRRVAATGYKVPKNCCNKPLADWQLADIAKATGVRFDRRKINCLSKLQSYAEARATGDDTWVPFNLSGFYSGHAVSFTEGGKPGKHQMFKTSTGYDAFKRNGKKVTMGTLKALLGE